MPKVRAKVVKVKSKSGSELREMSGAFADVTKQIDPGIAMKKIQKITLNLSKIAGIFDQYFNKTDFIEPLLSGFRKKSIQVFINILNKEIQESHIDINPDKDLSEKIVEIYKKVKSSNACKLCVIIHRDLSRYGVDLENPEKLSDSFIVNSSIPIKPFTFSGFSLTNLWANPNFTERHNTFTLTMLHIIYSRVKIITDTVVSVDFDVKKMASGILDLIDTFKAHVPRCDKAFRTIRQSIGLLETHIPSYYKDIAVSNDYTSLITGFLFEVRKNIPDDDKKLIGQLTRITTTIMKKINDARSNTPDVNRVLGDMPGISRFLDFVDGGFDAYFKSYLDENNMKEEDIFGDDSEPENESECKPENESERKPEDKSDNESEYTSEHKSEHKPEHKPEINNDTKTGTKIETELEKQAIKTLATEIPVIENIPADCL